MNIHTSLISSDFLDKTVPVNQNYSWLDSLTTDVSEDFVFVTQTDDGLQLNIAVFVEKNTCIKEMILYSIKNGDELRLPLAKTQSKNQDIWRLKMAVECESILNPFLYRFKINTNSESFFYDAQGIYKYKVNNVTNFKFYYQCLAPAWLDAAIVYHIFIDRFKKILPQKSNERSWDSVPCGGINEFYGGDILGVIDRLDYLLDLGVNTLCLTPIFKSSTNHRYDVEDYFAIDESLGGDEAFKLLAQLCKEKNIKIILDGVFNHVSARSQWFNRDGFHLNKGAYQDASSIYTDYFNFNSHPEQYEAFWADKYLPKLNYRSAGLRDIIYKSENSIIKYWMSEPYSIAGWRLDASCMIGKYNNHNINSEVLTELYFESKKNKKDCYIFGENPFDPSEVAPYVHMDGTTNYAGFYVPLVSWLDSSIDFNVNDFDAGLKECRALIGYQFTKSCKTFFGNHDKNRLFGLLNGDVEKYFIALTFLFSYPGVPCIYYGEEIGLQDTNILDDSRICMKWDVLTSINSSIYSYTKNLVALYKKSKAMQSGSFRALFAGDNVFIYERFYQDEFILVVLNNSTQIVKSISVQVNSIARLSIRNLYSCLDASLNVSVINNIIKIENITSKLPVIISSKTFI